ncbi:MAG: hypothetical protein GX626_10780 [Spirochaetales bacterium]|jgi:quercetin dioxygenase-like cupin family protein|nr:hypothetical protein [Spirochaetales bacterium]
MIEKQYSYTQTNEKVIEKLVGDDMAMINHIVLAAGEALPEHYSDSNVYLVVTRGNLTIQLDEQETHHYQASVVNIPFHTKMNISNAGKQVLEFFIVKAPHPRVYKAETV